MRKIICDLCGSEIKSESDVSKLDLHFSSSNTLYVGEKYLELCNNCTHRAYKFLTQFETGT